MSPTSRFRPGQSDSRQCPGGNGRAIFYIDDKATPEQREAILSVFSGKLGGPLAGVASLVGERVAVHFVPVEHRVEGGKGTLRVGKLVVSGDGSLHGCQRATHHHRAPPSSAPSLGRRSTWPRRRITAWLTFQSMGTAWEFSGPNAIPGDFHFEA